MEQGTSECIKAKSHKKITIKTEVLEAEESPLAYIEIEVDVSHLKQEPGLVVKQEGGRQGTDEQQCVPATSTHAIVGKTNATVDSVDQGQLSICHIKEEPEDTDLGNGPTLFKHTDSHRTDQTDFNDMKQENTTINSEPKEGLRSISDGQVVHNQVRYESIKSNWKDNVALPHCSSSTPMKEVLQIYKCKLCEESFECELYLSRHTKQVHESEDNDSQIYKCDKCLKVCKSKHYLWQHSNRVHGTGSHKCSQCNKEFKCKEYLSKHVRYTHSKQQYECDICKKMCKSRARLSNHVSSFHRYRFADPEDGNYRCDKCMKTFQSKSVLMSHLRYMHGTQRYKCTDCDREFKCMRYLRSHINYAHSEQQYECDICKKIFKSKRTLAAHISTLRSHRFQVVDPNAQIYTCDLCQKIFWTKQGVREHVVSVHAEGIYQCSKCKRNYKCIRYLQHHEKLIHGKAKHECHLCHRRFNARYKVMNHYEGVHSLKYDQFKSYLRPYKINVPRLATGEMRPVAFKPSSTQRNNMAILTKEQADVKQEMSPVVFQPNLH